MDHLSCLQEVAVPRDPTLAAICMGMSVGFDHGFQKKNEFLGEVWSTIIIPGFLCPKG
jgi:hypothetical protein